MPLTITEGLAEIKTINKRLASKRQLVNGYLYRQDHLKDPLLDAGGSQETIKRERQAIADLEERIVAIRIAIDGANNNSDITIAGKARSIQQWLTWRRDVAPGQQAFLGQMRDAVARMRRDAATKALTVIEKEGGGKASDIVVNISESELAKEIEQMEETLGNLDGMLSLKNATVIIEGV